MEDSQHLCPDCGADYVEAVVNDIASGAGADSRLMLASLEEGLAVRAGGGELLVAEGGAGRGDRGDVDGVEVGVRTGDDERRFCQDDGVPSDQRWAGHTPARAGRQDIDEERPGS